MLLFILFIYTFLLIAYLLYAIKYLNPYKLYMVFGKKGSGKTTYMCKLAIQYHKKGWNLYSNIDLPYARKFDVKMIGKCFVPPHSVLLIDEVGMIWDNRNYKNFSDDVRDYFKLQRQSKNIVYLFSQTFDVDVKIRNLTDAMFLVTSPLPCISILRRIKRCIVLLQPTAENEGRISDSLEFTPIWMNLFGAKSLQITWIPKYSSYFKSFNPKKQSVHIDNYSKDSLIVPPKSLKERLLELLSRCRRRRSKNSDDDVLM